MVVNTVAPKAQVNTATTPQTTGMVAGNFNRQAARVPAQTPAAQPVTRQAYTPTQSVAPEYHPTNFAVQTASANREANAIATPFNPHVSSQQGGQNGVSNASQFEHVQVSPAGVQRTTTTTENGQTTQSSSFTPAQGQGASTQGSAQNTASAANTNVGRTNPYVNTQLPQDAQNSEKNTTIQVDHSKLDNDIAQAKKDGVQVTHTADDQPIVVHNQNEAHDFEDQASQEYDNEDQAIIKADNIQKAYNADRTLIDTENTAIQNAANEAKQAGVVIDPSKTESLDYSNHTPSLQDAQTLHNAITVGAQNTLNSIKQAEQKLQQERNQAWQAMPDKITGMARGADYNKPVPLTDSGIKNTKGESAADGPVYAYNGGSKHLIYCVQPYGEGPGLAGTSDHVTLATGIAGNADQQRTIAGILYNGFGGPGDTGKYSQLETHLALSYYLYKYVPQISGLHDWEVQHEGVTDQVADQWLHYGKVQQLINEASNWDKDGSVVYRLYSGHSDQTATNGSAHGAGSQLLVAANFQKLQAVHAQAPQMEASTPTVKTNYHYMSAKLGDTDTQTQTGGSAMPNININVSANASAQAKANANANVNVNTGANASGQGNANSNANGCGMSRGHGCGMCGAGGRGCGAGAATGAGLGVGSGYGSCGLVESVPACGGYGAGEASPLVATGAVSGQGVVAMPVAAAGNGAGVGAGNGAGNGVAMPATGQKNSSILADLAAVAAAVIGGSMLLKKRNA